MEKKTAQEIGKSIDARAAHYGGGAGAMRDYLSNGLLLATFLSTGTRRFKRTVKYFFIETIA